VASDSISLFNAALGELPHAQINLQVRLPDARRRAEGPLALETERLRVMPWL
jgi:hypothetical protein